MSLSNMTGLKTCDEKKIKCRFCANCFKGGIHNRRCAAFEKKPEDVYYENASCSKFKQGEDMLKYEIEI